MLIPFNDARIFREFWASFLNTKLYDTGFADAVCEFGLHKSVTWNHYESNIEALSAMKGYVTACKLSLTYQTPKWWMAELVMLAVTSQLVYLKNHDLKPANAQSCVDQWTRELIAELDKI